MCFRRAKVVQKHETAKKYNILYTLFQQSKFFLLLLHSQTSNHGHNMRTIELLAPAKNLECGIAAIDHGADAVYIGAQRFGARAAAGNSVTDIANLCQYAHQFGAKVYVTVNTIIFDDELDDTTQLISELQAAGADALLIQDMALSPISLQTPSNKHHSIDFHASTQTDNRTPEKVRWLYEQGFSRVVLARELSINEIAAIHHEVPEVELEVFVHGALCVSYSGLCYASQFCFGRSANRGECAQLCRMKMDLFDTDGHELEHQRHLLSLKDLCLIDHLEQLTEAGATSFKIEGRLKDIAYVKNVTAAYSERLNQLVARYPNRYRRASLGKCTYTFHPDLSRTFNRGYTTYFANGRRPDIFSPDTPKAIGQYVGTVKQIQRNSFSVSTLYSLQKGETGVFSNGDGLCYFNSERELVGFRVNRAEGNRLFPLTMPKDLKPGLALYRNNDQEMERLLNKPSSVRKIPVTMTLEAIPTGFLLTMCLNSVPSDNNETSNHHLPTAKATADCPHQPSNKPQDDNIIRQLTKLGGTPFTCTEFSLPPHFNYFIPNSILSDLRRKVVEQFSVAASDFSRTTSQYKSQQTGLPPYSLPYLYNVANSKARTFYEQKGIETAPAFELTTSSKGKATGGVLLMQCRHCLRFALGHCAKHGGTPPTWHEPLYLHLSDGRRFRLEFDCRHCQMNVWADNAI